MTSNPHRPTTIALFETTNGGSGYLRRAAGDLPRIARRALSILGHEPPCVRGCYACLLNYYNQRDHGRIDKRLVEALLRELAESSQPVGDMSEGELPPIGHGQHASPIEVLLDVAMRRNLPPFALQSEVLESDTRSRSTPKRARSSSAARLPPVSCSTSTPSSTFGKETSKKYVSLLAFAFG